MDTVEMLANVPVLLFADQQQWQEWLDTHHTEPTGVWLKHAKKEAGVASVSYAEALEVALCYGWIDGQKKSYDGTFFLQKFTPRRAKSIWSKINTERAERLIAAGKMRPAGFKEIEAAKRDGRWDAAYQSQSTVTIPDDLQAELDKHPEAKAFFDMLNKVNRYAIYFRLQNAKKPETRKARLDKFIAMLEAHEKIYP